jgi:DNA repair protein RAD5
VARDILEPLMLRRKKNTLDVNHHPIIVLPHKDVETEFLEFSREEQDIYDAINFKCKVKLDYYCKSGSLLMLPTAHFFKVMVR